MKMNPCHLFVLIIIFPVCNTAGGENYIQDFRRLTHVPREIPDDVKKIYLNNNEISNIESGAFAFHFHCNNLRLDHNQLTEIRNDMWIGLVALQYLSLEHNAIGYIDPSAFSDLPNLKGLYLHDNKLTTLPDDIFPPTQMPEIEILTLHDNSLKRNDLGWLRNLCEGGQIQQYTIQGDDISCTNNDNNDIKQDKRYVTHRTTSLLPIQVQDQDENVVRINVVESDTRTDLLTWILISVAVGVIVLIGTATTLVLRHRARRKTKKLGTASELQKCELDYHYQEPNESPLLVNRLSIT